MESLRVADYLPCWPPLGCAVHVSPKTCSSDSPVCESSCGHRALPSSGVRRGVLAVDRLLGVHRGGLNIGGGGVVSTASGDRQDMAMRAALATMLELRAWHASSTSPAATNGEPLEFCLYRAGGGVFSAPAGTGRDDLTPTGIPVEVFFFLMMVDPGPLRFDMSMSFVIHSFHWTNRSIPRSERDDRAIPCNTLTELTFHANQK